jgi:hypothetical protein
MVARNAGRDQPSLKARIILTAAVLKQIGKAPEGVEDAFFDAVAKIQASTWSQLVADQGLDLERDQSRKDAGVWTFRINRGWRALCLVRTGPVIEVFGIRDPTAAHSVRRR